MFFRMKTLLAALLFVVLLTACGSTESAEEASDPLTVVDNAFEKAAAWQSCSLSMRSYLNILSADSQEASDAVWSQISGEGVFLTEPLKSHFLMTMVQETISETSVTIEQYMDETEEGLVVYLKSDEGWLKYITDAEEKVSSSGSNPMENLAEMRKYLVGAEYLQDEMINNRNSMKYEATFSYEMYERLLAGSSVALESSGNETVTYNVWLDKDSGDILKYEANLDQLSDEDGKWNVTLGVDVDLFAHDNAVEDFVIPAAVIAAATELEKE